MGRWCFVGGLSPLMARNRSYRILSWNVRGLSDPSKCITVKSFLKFSKCCVICFQETKLAATSPAKFSTFCGFHLKDYRTLDADGSKGGLWTAWNPCLFDCVHERVGAFSISLVLRRRVDGLLFTVSNIFGPTLASLKPVFFQEIRSIGPH